MVVSIVKVHLTGQNVVAEMGDHLIIGMGWHRTGDLVELVRVADMADVVRLQ